MRSWRALSKPSDPVTHLQSNVRAPFQAFSGNPEAQLVIAQLETAFTDLSSLLAAATPTPMATDVRDDEELPAGQREGHLARGVGSCQGFRAVAGGPARGRARGQEGKDGGVRRASEASLAISNATSTESTVLVAFKRPQARDRASNPSPRFWSEKDCQVASPIRKHSGQLPVPTSLRGNLDSWCSTQFLTATFGLSKRHICQEASKWRQRSGGLVNAAGLPLSRAQRSLASTTRPTEAAWRLQGRSTSVRGVPTEFEAMLEEAADLAPEALEHPLRYLRSRILERHIHAMLKRGVTLVAVYLEPGLRASGLNLWLLEVLAACILCFDGPWIAMVDWNMEPKDLAQADWLDAVNGKVAATSAATCAGGAGAVLNYFVLSEAMAHLVQQVKVVDNSPTTPQSLVSLTLTATSWGHSGLGAGLAGVAARSRSYPEPDPRSLRDPPQAFSGEEQRVGHRARFSRPGNAQRHEETLQQKGGSLACLSPLGGAGGWQHGCLEEGASFAGGYVATVSQLARFLLVTRSWPLGSRLGFSVTRSYGTLFAQSCNLW